MHRGRGRACPDRQLATDDRRADPRVRSAEQVNNVKNVVAHGLRYVDLDDTFGCYIPQNESSSAAEVEFIYTEIFRENCYLRGGITLHDAAFVVDVGANVGLFSLYVKAKYPNARILAFEPMPSTHRALRANLEHHKVDGVIAIEQALGAKWEPEVTFTFYRDIPGNSTRYPEHKDRTWELIAGLPESIVHAFFGNEGFAVAERLLQGKLEVEVSVDRLSDVLARYETPEIIDLVKIDVEGAELDVLGGIDETDWARIRQLVAEVQDLDGELSAVRDLLETKGFDVSVPKSALSLLRTYTVYAHRR
ncbi:MAG: FkbM family methyltransferase [Pseudonocardiaceae bacterium]